MKLHGYHKSSATLRVIIALELKKLDYEVIAINLKKGEQENMLVPILEDKDKIITQSLSIIEYLDEWYTYDGIKQRKTFLPAYVLDKVKVRELAQIIACDIHPIDNLRVLKYLQNNFNITEDDFWFDDAVESNLEAFVGSDGIATYEWTIGDEDMIDPDYQDKAEFFFLG